MERKKKEQLHSHLCYFLKYVHPQYRFVTSEELQGAKGRSLYDMGGLHCHKGFRDLRTAFPQAPSKGLSPQNAGST